MKKLHSYRLSEETEKNLKEIIENNGGNISETEVIEKSIELVNNIEYILDEYYEMYDKINYWHLCNSKDTTDLLLRIRKAYQT